MMSRKDLARHLRKEAQHLEKHLIGRPHDVRTPTENHHTLFLLRAAAAALEMEDKR